jgi:hypothetical protein
MPNSIICFPFSVTVYAYFFFGDKHLGLSFGRILVLLLAVCLVVQLLLGVCLITVFSLRSLLDYIHLKHITRDMCCSWWVVFVYSYYSLFIFSMLSYSILNSPPNLRLRISFKSYNLIKPLTISSDRITIFSLCSILFLLYSLPYFLSSSIFYILELS